jgi:hypothetical protein
MPGALEGVKAEHVVDEVDVSCALVRRGDESAGGKRKEGRSEVPAICLTKLTECGQSCSGSRGAQGEGGHKLAEVSAIAQWTILQEAEEEARGESVACPQAVHGTAAPHDRRDDLLYAAIRHEARRPHRSRLPAPRSSLDSGPYPRLSPAVAGEPARHPTDPALATRQLGPRPVPRLSTLGSRHLLSGPQRDDHRSASQPEEPGRGGMQVLPAGDSPGLVPVDE